jgi:hypothetical protein
MWKEFRKEIGQLSLDSAVSEVANMWGGAPYINYYVNPNNPKEWPDPWTMLAENYYCDLAKALGILYTIYFSEHKNAHPEIRIYYDYKTKERHNVVWLKNGKYILNWWPYEIVNTSDIEKETDVKLLHRYKEKDLNLDRY